MIVGATSYDSDAGAGCQLKFVKLVGENTIQLPSMTTMNRRQLMGGAIALFAPSASWGATGRNEILYGVADAPRAPIELVAGPWSALFEPDLGFLRFIKFNGAEVLRGIYAAVRDKS